MERDMENETENLLKNQSEGIEEAGTSGSLAESREKIIIRTSVIGIVVNLLIAAAKVGIGILSSSIAIISEGVNNAADALTSVLTLVGTRLAAMHPDKKHPFGYGRIEYLTSLVISVLILVTGVEMLISSIKLIFHPEPLAMSYSFLILVAVFAVVKFLLGVYTMRMGKKAESGALTAVGLESRNDAFASLVTIISVLVYLLTGHSIDAYAGVLTSLLILKAGGEVLLETISELLGRPGNEELAATLYKEIRGTEGVIGAADMMLHNYGPESYSGSVNIEIDQGKTVGEIYRFIHRLQLEIMHKYKVTMVFGIYAVDNQNEEMRRLRKTLSQFVRSKEHVKSYHALYIEPDSDNIYCDFIVDYELEDWEALEREFKAFMAEQYPGKNFVLTIETEYV